MLTSKGKPINSFSDVDSFKDLKKEFQENKNKEVKIGFPSGSQSTKSEDESGVTALFKATVNNFGLGVPKRPFMQVAFFANVDKYKKYIAKNIFKKSYTEILQALGIVSQGDVQKTIRDFKSPPNSQATINKKGVNDPLIDSSHMLNSVTFAIEDKK